MPRILRSRRVVGKGFLATTCLLSVPIFLFTAGLFVLFPRVGLSLLLLNHSQKDFFAINMREFFSHAYDDEDAYNKIVNDADGPFARAASEHGIEDVADWLGSVKGVTRD